jgi:hypothetical protein
VISFGGKARFIGITTIAAAAAIAAGQPAPAWAAPGAASPASPAHPAATQSATPGPTTTQSEALEPFGQDGVISGTVDGPARVPLAGICVTASGPAGVRAARTNAGGRYVLTGVRAGAYSLAYTDCASPDSYLPGRYPAPVVVNAAQPALLAPVSLTPASPARAIATENAYARSHQALRTAAASRPLVSGTVRSAAGRPLAGICVQATVSITISAGPVSSSIGGLWVSQTDASGRYSIPAFVGGKGATIRILFTDGCGSTGNYAPQYWRDAAIRHTATVLHQVTAGTTFSRIDARLTRGAAVSGTVRGGSATGPGLAGVCVFASGRDAQTGIDLSATTGAGGRYTLPGLGTGPYQIWFATGCGVKGNYIGSRYGRVHARTGATTTGVNGFLPPGATISGTVTSGEPDGAPVSGICVNLVNSSGSGDSATTGKSGTYAISRLTPGRYSVYFTGGCGNSGSYAPQYFDAEPAAGAASSVRVAAGGAATADAAMQPGGTLAGRVTSPAGKPVAGVCVVPVSQQEGDLEAGNQAAAGIVLDTAFTDTLTTNSAGQYSEANLAPGLYLVGFIQCGFSRNSLGPAWFGGNGSAPRWLSVNAGAVTTLNVALPRSGAISGTVTAASGRALGKTCVVAAPATMPESGPLADAFALLPAGSSLFTTKDGGYTLTGLAPGRYTVSFARCNAGGYAPAWYKNKLAGQAPAFVTVRSGQTTRGINGVLGAGKSASGVIRSGSTHRPVAFACVIAVPGKSSLQAALDNPFSLEVAATGKTGRFTLHHLAPGSYRLTAGQCAGGPLAFITEGLHVPAGKAAAPAVTLTLPRAGSISGAVTAPAADGGGAAACVIATPVTGGGFGLSAAANAKGRYTITDLAPGRYQIQFTSDCVGGTAELAPATASSVTVTGGRTTTVNGTLAAVGDISGTVTAGGDPVAGECVAAFTSATASAPAATAITGADGSYQIGFLAPGRYVVRFSTGCGDSGYATQWWNDTATGSPGAAGATRVGVVAGAASPGVNAVLAK